jgi:hypothetical protein
MEERDQQDNMMAQIYQLAERVIVWLGEGNDYTDWVIERLHDPKFRRTLEGTLFGANLKISLQDHQK